MPLFIFIPSEPAVGGDLFGVPIAPFDGEDHIPRNGNIVFGIGATGTVVFDYSSILIELNGIPVVTAGIPSAGYSLSLQLGHFYNIDGLVLTLNPSSNLDSFSTYTVNIEFNTINLKPYSMYYTFTTSDRTTYGSNFPFGNTQLNRYYLNKDLRRNSHDVGDHSRPTYSYTNFNILDAPVSSTKIIIQTDSVGGIPESLNQYLGDFEYTIDTYAGEDVSINSGLTSSLSESNNNFIGSEVDFNVPSGSVYTQTDGRIAQSQGQATPFPSMLGPRFGAKVLDRQDGALKIQKRLEDA